VLRQPQGNRLGRRLQIGKRCNLRLAPVQVLSRSFFSENARSAASLENLGMAFARLLIMGSFPFDACRAAKLCESTFHRTAG
jgi:hypothetical protein